MDDNELMTLFAHAMLTGLATNGHLLTANASGEDIGRMIREKSESIIKGWHEGYEDDDD